MHWHDQAFILSYKNFGEKDVIVELLTARHGRHFGLLRFGATSRYRSLLQRGNFVTARWNARLNEQLGSFKLELLAPYAASIMSEPLWLYGYQLLLGHLRLLPERQAHNKIFQFVAMLFNKTTDQKEGFIDKPAQFMAWLIRFELLYLEEMGYRLSLDCCAVSKEKQNLYYVSPKTGCAVTQKIGYAWRDKLLLLPQFLLSFPLEPPSLSELNAGFRLTGYFLERYLWKDNFKGPAMARHLFIKKFCQ